jgi:bifunctional polynucleotide phosphatase/kinase
MKPDKVPKANQTKLSAFKAKAAAVFSQLDLPISIYAATEKDIFRKPRTGMWKELLEDYDIHLPGDLDLENSLFVGDAGGRTAGGGGPKDFSCSDRFAVPVKLAECLSYLQEIGTLQRMLASRFTRPRNSS